MNLSAVVQVEDLELKLARCFKNVLELVKKGVARRPVPQGFKVNEVMQSGEG